jgi:co-chaperonin GroES (HSP10)
MTELGIRPKRDWIFIDIDDRGAKILKSGLIQLDDDMRDGGIRPRWTTVLSVGEAVAEETGIKPGDRLLLEHLGWTRPFHHETPEGTREKIWATALKKVMVHQVVNGDDRTIQAVKGKIVVQPDADIVQTKGGLFIPQTSEHAVSETGKLVEWTTEGDFEDAKIGQKVMYTKGSENDRAKRTFEVDGQKYVCLNEDEVLGLID